MAQSWAKLLRGITLCQLALGLASCSTSDELCHGAVFNPIRLLKVEILNWICADISINISISIFGISCSTLIINTIKNYSARA